MQRFLLLVCLLAAALQATAQSTNQKVYDLFQAKCVTCHDGNAANNGGLDLTGSVSQVYARLYMQDPINAQALSMGQKLIYPGRTDRSAIFRRVNNGFEPTVALAAGEGDAAHAPNAPQLTVEEKELIRQWIQFGAPQTGNVNGEDLIDDYYNVNGQPSFPNGAPAPPDPADGFQIKMGPFFLEPNGEIEWFQKYQLNLPANVEVDRIETFFSPYSHHFIMYDFETPADAAGVPEGYRSSANHNNISLVYAIQEPTDLRLPEKTAFRWENNRVLDLNSHYINYGSNTFGAEVYVNVYTKPVGTAVQEMQTLLIPYTNMYIPANGNTYTFQQPISFPVGQVYLWGVMGHTHKYGTGYKVFRRNANGSRGQIIYDAACFQGVPGCQSPFYDYQHIPMRYFNTVTPLNMNNGFIHEATYANTGNTAVTFGTTSDDEMMVVVAMYLQDTTGLNVLLDPGNPVGVEEVAADNPLSETRISPNPAGDFALLDFPMSLHRGRFALYDPMGRQVQAAEAVRGPQYRIDRNGLAPGIYFWRVEDGHGNVISGRVVFAQP
jgi:hypothetical protein